LTETDKKKRRRYREDSGKEKKVILICSSRSGCGATKQAQSKRSSISTTTVSVWSLGGEIRGPDWCNSERKCVPTCTICDHLVCCVSSEAQHAAGFLRHTNLLTEISDTRAAQTDERGGQVTHIATRLLLNLTATETTAAQKVNTNHDECTLTRRNGDGRHVEKP